MNIRHLVVIAPIIGLLLYMNYRKIPNDVPVSIKTLAQTEASPPSTASISTSEHNHLKPEIAQMSLEAALSKLSELRRLEGKTNRNNFLQELDFATISLPPEQLTQLARSLSLELSDSEFHFAAKMFQQIVMQGRFDLAEDWLFSEANDPTATNRFQKLISRLAAADKAGFDAATKSLNSGETKNIALWAGVSSAAKKSLDDGVSVASQIPVDSKYRSRAEGLVVLSAVESGTPPQQIFESIRKDVRWQSKEELMRTLASLWADSSPQKAAAAIETMDDAGLKEAFGKGLVENWSRQNPEAASNWIDSLSSGKLKNSCISALITTIQSQDPESAIKWAGAVSDSALKQQLINSIYTNLKQTSPEKARSLFPQRQ